MDPATMAAAAQGIGSAVGAAAGGSNGSGAPTKVGFDNSGWTIASGGSKAQATNTKSESTDQNAGGTNAVGDWVKWVLLAVVAVAAIKAVKKGGA